MVGLLCIIGRSKFRLFDIDVVSVFVCVVGYANQKPNFLFLVIIYKTFFRQEMVRRYADAEATMGEGKKVGETGPDDAGKNLEPTTVKVSGYVLHILCLSFCKIPI